MSNTNLESNRARKRRVRKFVPGIGWVRPKVGYCWTLRGDKVRTATLPAWGSRKFGAESIGEQMSDWC